MLLKVEKNDIRIDSYLKDNIDFSRSKIQKLIKQGKVFLNGKVISSSTLVHQGDVIDIDDTMEYDTSLKKEDIPLDIVYEDDYLIIINKPSGMVVHPAPGHYSSTLVNALLGRFSLSNNDELRPGIVHRIDKDTSGLLIVAKTDEVHDILSRMIKDKLIERKYIALVDGVIPHETGTIDAPIGRDIKNRQKMMVTDINGKDSVTHFKVLKRYTNHTLIECKLDTGRTHQIRVHMAYIGYPIVNDPVYGRGKKTTEFGQLLHSYSIKFIHPITKEELYFKVDVPEEFKKIEKEVTNNK